jgi:hypothetical protein
MTKTFRTVLIVLFCLLSSTPLLLGSSPAEDMADAANNFLAALTADQHKKAFYEFKDEQRFDWHFVPKARKGLPWKEMTSAQRLLAHTLLNSGLSHRGYMKATTIMSLEQILHELENKSPTRDADLYYVTVFGKPGKDAWGWRVEGHHLSLNFALHNDQVISVTPSFLGTNPAQVPSGPRKGLRVLGSEEDLARQLIKSLTPEQRKTAVINTEAPRDIITASDRKARTLEPLGIAAAQLSKQQQEMLMDLLKEYLFRARAEVAEADLKSIAQAGKDKMHFAWAGGLEPGQGHYYRIQGPTFLMEYDNTQNNANHIHAVWRSLPSDFGEDILRKHYEQVTHPK